MAKRNRSISAESMHQCMLSDASGEVWSGVTLLPFFDATGQIRVWLVVQPKMERTWVLEGRFGKCFGGYLYHGTLGHAAAPDDEAIERLGRLNHYDPWWLLTLPAFVQEPWVPTLKATNIAKRSDYLDLAYTRQLDRTARTLDLTRSDVLVRPEKMTGWRIPDSEWQIRIPRAWRNPVI